MHTGLLWLCCWWALLATLGAQEENSTWDGCCSDNYVSYYEYEIYVIDDLGDNVTLNCSITYTTRPGDVEPVAWMLPDLTLYGINDSDSKYTISDDGYLFTVHNVYQEDFGLYHCMLRYYHMYENRSALWMTKYGINTEGPYYEDLWEKYDLNTVIALSAFFGWLLLCLVIWLVWYFRWIPPPDDASSYQATYTGTRNEAYENENGSVPVISSKELDAQSPTSYSYEDTDRFTYLADGTRFPADEDFESTPL